MSRIKNAFHLQNGNTWVEAQGQCEFLGGYLAEATTEEEHEFLKSITVVLEVYCPLIIEKLMHQTYYIKSKTELSTHFCFIMLGNYRKVTMVDWSNRYGTRVIVSTMIYYILSDIQFFLIRIASNTSLASNI